MSEKPLQPESTDPPDETADLQAQVDLLLAQIEQQVPEATPSSQGATTDAPGDDALAEDIPDATAEPSEPPSEPAAPSPEPIDASTAAEAADAAEAESPGDAAESIDRNMHESEALAQQIQALLDEAQAEAEGPGGDAAATTTNAATTDSATTDAPGPAAPDASSPAAAPAEPTAPSPPDPEPTPAAPSAADAQANSDAADTAQAQRVHADETAQMDDGMQAGVEEAEPELDGMAGEEEPVGDFESPEVVINDSGVEAGADVAAAPTSANAQAPAASSAVEPAIAQQAAKTDDANQQAPAVDAAEASDAAAVDENDDLDETDPNLISRIDQMLADEAEDVLSSGEFESVSDLLDEGDQEQSEAGVESTAPAAASEPSTTAQPAPSGATASDVARELDEQPEQRAAAATAATAPTAEAADTASVDAGAANESAPGATSRAGAFKAHRRRLAELAAALRQTCGMINAPLYRFSPEVRSTIGWVGVLTVFNALCLMLVGLIR